MKLKPWHLFVATGLLVLVLVWGLDAEQGQEHPGPLVPYTLIALPILFISGIAWAVRDRMNRKP